MTRIRIVTSGGQRVRIDVGPASGVTISIRSSEVRLCAGRGPEDLVIGMSGDRKAAKRARALPGPGEVSSKMQAAAVRAFLAGADVDRLGRSLATVYYAMEAVRLGRDDDLED